MNKKLTPTQKIKRALSALDSAIQEWYQENNPKSQTRYASSCIMNHENMHVSRITIDKGPGDAGNWIEIVSSRHWNKEEY